MSCAIVTASAPNVAWSQAKPVTHEGVPGVWFPAPEAEDLLNQEQKIADLEAAQQAARDLITIRDKQLELATQTTTKALEIADLAQDNAKTWKEAHDTILEERSSRISPVIMLLIGIGVGGLITGAGAWAGSR